MLSDGSLTPQGCGVLAGMFLSKVLHGTFFTLTDRTLTVHASAPDPALYASRFACSCTCHFPVCALAHECMYNYAYAHTYTCTNTYTHIRKARDVLIYRALLIRRAMHACKPVHAGLHINK